MYFWAHKLQWRSIKKISILVLLFFGGNFLLNFATDTYATFGNMQYAGKDMILRNGRIFTGILYLLADTLKIPTTVFYYISYVQAFIFLICSIYCFQRILEKHIAEAWLTVSLSFITIANIFIIEYFMFVEKGMFMFAIFFSVIAVYETEKYYKQKDFKYICATIVSLLIAVFTYQAITALYIILCIPLAYRYSDGWKRYFTNLIMTGSSYIGTCICNLLVLKFLAKSERIKNNTSLFDKLKTVAAGTWSCLDTTFKILPQHYYLAGIVVIALFSIVMIIWNKKHIGMQLFNLLVIVSGTIVASTSSILVASGWFSARVVYPLASMMGILLVNYFINISPKNPSLKRGAIIVTGCIAFMGSIFALQYINFNKIYIDKYKVNYADQCRCYMIKEAIDVYERETGQQISQIAIYRDASPDQQYTGVYDVGDLVVSAFECAWSDVVVINYYLDTAYEKCGQSKTYIDYFANQDWHAFSLQQMVFDGEVLHYCVY